MNTPLVILSDPVTYIPFVLGLLALSYRWWQKRRFVLLALLWGGALLGGLTLVFVTTEIFGGETCSAREAYRAIQPKARTWRQDARFAGIHGMGFEQRGEDWQGESTMWYAYFLSDSDPEYAISIQFGPGGKSGRIRTWTRKRVEEHWHPLFALQDKWIDSDAATAAALQHANFAQDEVVAFESFELFVSEERPIWKITLLHTSRQRTHIIVDAITGAVISSERSKK